MEERKSIGIFGVQQGVGVTHLCTALTHYCADCLKSHTALVELSGNHELEELQKQNESTGERRGAVAALLARLTASLPGGAAEYALGGTQTAILYLLFALATLAAWSAEPKKSVHLPT